jgi:hypothetical protein
MPMLFASAGGKGRDWSLTVAGRMQVSPAAPVVGARLLPVTEAMRARHQYTARPRGKPRVLSGDKQPTAIRRKKERRISRLVHPRNA